MKNAVFITAILLSIGSGAAVVGYDGPEDQPHIMGAGSSASSTTAVSPNGTEYRTTVKMSGRNPNVTDGVVTDVNQKDGIIEFEGLIQAPTPCHTLAHEVEKTGNESYSLNIKTTNEDSSGFCTQQAVMIEYNASFEKNASSYSLSVNHDGSEIEKLDYPETHSDKVSGPIAGLINWFQKLL